MNTSQTIQIYQDARLTIFVVCNTDYQKNTSNKGHRLFGNIKPIAIIVCSTESTYALDMEAKPTALDQLKQESPELGAILR